MKKASGVRMGLLVMVSVLQLSSPVLAAWGSKEMDTEKIAVTFAREVERGAYKIVTTEELKGWIDHVGRQDGLQECLPLSRRHQGLG